MRYLNRASSCFVLTIVGGLTLFGPPVRGASQGIREFQAQHVQAQQASTLPALHEAVPLHVPVLSNSALIKLWKNNEFSPILRDAGIQMQLCAAVSAARGVNPTRFDRTQPIVGRLIRDTNYFNKVLAAYIANPARFTRYHHHLVPFIRGCALMTETPTTPPVPGTNPGQIEIPGGSGVSPAPGGISEGPGPGSGPSPPPEAVPAPSSLVLLIFGMIFVAARHRGRRPLASLLNRSAPLG
jgi:hypothetical protein